MKRHYVTCDCGNSVDRVEFIYDKDDLNELFITYHSATVPFWKRVRYAIQYIFGDYSYGMHGEVIVSPEEIVALDQFLREYLAWQRYPDVDRKEIRGDIAKQLSEIIKEINDGNEPQAG